LIASAERLAVCLARHDLAQRLALLLAAPQLAGWIPERHDSQHLQLGRDAEFGGNGVESAGEAHPVRTNAVFPGNQHHVLNRAARVRKAKRRRLGCDHNRQRRARDVRPGLGQRTQALERRRILNHDEVPRLPVAGAGRQMCRVDNPADHLVGDWLVGVLPHREQGAYCFEDIHAGYEPLLVCHQFPSEAAFDAAGTFPAPCPGVSHAHDRQTGDLRWQRVQRLTPDLERRVNTLADHAQAADGVRPFGEHKWLRLLRGDDRFTAVLLWQGSRVVGAAHCHAYHTAAPDRPCRLTTELVVAPEARGHGLGRKLLQCALTLARDEGAAEFHAWAYGDLLAARTLALRFGLERRRLLSQYTLESERLPVQAALPDGMRLRAFDPPRDAYVWLALHNRVFATHPEQGAWDAADLQARLEQPWFNPRDLLIAEADNMVGMLGFCWVKLPLDPRQPGEIYIVGVHPAARGRGLGNALTTAGLAHIRASGRPGAMLYVEADNLAAVTMYERFGFVRRWQHACYVRTLAAQDDQAVIDVADQQQVAHEGNVPGHA
jgi:mycothiol synthase